MARSHLYRMIRKAGTLEELKLILWRSIKSLEDAMKSASDTEELRRCVNSLVQVSREYLRLHEALDVNERLERLEEALKQGNAATGSVINSFPQPPAATA